MLPHRQTLPALMDGRGRGRRINPSQIQARPPPLTRAPVITARRNNYRVDQQQDFQHHNNQQGEPAATAPARLVADANDIRRQLEQQVNGNPGDNDTEPESDEEAETNRDRELRALYGEPIRLIPPEDGIIMPIDAQVPPMAKEKTRMMGLVMRVPNEKVRALKAEIRETFKYRYNFVFKKTWTNYSERTRQNLMNTLAVEFPMYEWEGWRLKTILLTMAEDASRNRRTAQRNKKRIKERLLERLRMSDVQQERAPASVGLDRSSVRVQAPGSQVQTASAAGVYHARPRPGGRGIQRPDDQLIQPHQRDNQSDQQQPIHTFPTRLNIRRHHEPGATRPRESSPWVRERRDDFTGHNGIGSSHGQETHGQHMNRRARWDSVADDFDENGDPQLHQEETHAPNFDRFGGRNEVGEEIDYDLDQNAQMYGRRGSQRFLQYPYRGDLDEGMNHSGNIGRNDVVLHHSRVQQNTTPQSHEFAARPGADHLDGWMMPYQTQPRGIFATVSGALPTGYRRENSPPPQNYERSEYRPARRSRITARAQKLGVDLPASTATLHSSDSEWVPPPTMTLSGRLSIPTRQSRTHAMQVENMRRHDRKRNLVARSVQERESIHEEWQSIRGNGAFGTRAGGRWNGRDHVGGYGRF